VCHESSIANFYKPRCAPPAALRNGARKKKGRPARGGPFINAPRSLCGYCMQPEIVKLNISVLQLKLPVVGSNSVAYQNVQSS
jgi:hypothetical protein